MIVQGSLILDPASAPVPGWIRLEGDRIGDVFAGDPPIGTRVDLGGPEYFITPGFVDAHTHLPQFNCIGYDGLPLLDWLDRVVYPAESRWASASFAARDAESALARMLKSGTLACAAFLTSHSHALASAAHANQRIPIRLRAGRVLMDRNAPAELCVTSTNVEHTIAHQHAPAASDDSAGEISINPRFAPACTDELLALAGRISAADPARWVHTHLAENHAECAAVQALFPDDRHYTAVYDRHRLLHKRTLLAHAIHLHDDEWELIRKRGSVVVHCPTANLFLESGFFNFDAARDHGVPIALGSDVGAGTEISMPRVARAMIETARWRRMTVAPNARVPAPAEAWCMITRGNADVLGWPELGRLEAGATAAFLILRTPGILPDEHTVARLIYEWKDEWIDTAVVNGNVYHTRVI
jgi:guanine deaminase